MCAQSLRYLKSKYRIFFSARWVSRYVGRDVILEILQFSANMIYKKPIIHPLICKVIEFVDGYINIHLIIDELARYSR